MYGLRGGRPAVSAVAHPAPRTLAEVVVDPRARARRGQQRDRFHGRHEAGLVQADADRMARAHLEQHALLGHVPVAVARAYTVRDRQPQRDRLLAEEIVDVLGEALDGPGPDTVEHRGERELARLPQLGGAALELLADRADGG